MPTEVGQIKKSDSLAAGLGDFSSTKPKAPEAGEKAWARPAIAIAAAAISVLVLFYVVARHTILAEPTAEEVSRFRVAVDAETQKVYPRVKIERGSSIPWKNPDTGKNTLFPPEACYWTKDGKAKVEPTYVLLNEFVGKPGPTLCPDCGRKVTVHNPQPPNDLMIKAYEAAAKSGK